MKACRDFRRFDASSEINENRAPELSDTDAHRLSPDPIAAQQFRLVLHRYTEFDRRFGGCTFQFNRRLRLVVNFATMQNHGGNRIEQAPAA